MPQPTEIVVRQKSRVLEIAFESGERFSLSFELLRVYSPSAEVRGHGPGQEVLQVGKRDVELTQLEPVGNYAVRPIFSDGHDTGIYSWDYLHWLGTHHEQVWREYLARLKAAGASRGAPEPAAQATAGTLDNAGEMATRQARRADAAHAAPDAPGGSAGSAPAAPEIREVRRRP
jgi:DUF971 family protein